MDGPDFNKRDSFHATIKSPAHDGRGMDTRPTRTPGSPFYSKEKHDRASFRAGAITPKELLNPDVDFFWYKNAGALDRETAPDGCWLLSFERP